MAKPDPRPDSVALLEKLLAALASKGIVTEAEIAEKRAATERASPELGARMVARAWADPEFRARLLADGTAVAAEMGAMMKGNPPLGVLEDTPSLHHLVVCTLCSCYPRAVLGFPPHWYKSSAYRARAVRDPRGVLAEWGTVLPPGMSVRVVDSTADYRWLVLPMRPAGTEGWSEDQLTALLGADELVGVALPRVAQAAAA
ncbi:MAG: nitrile hydratase subunit alpha [Alphaproteobacteria bacterium]|nr:nitrile hydratase subunit alpha [Alphaproteobacteria bacterium]